MKKEFYATRQRFLPSVKFAARARRGIVKRENSKNRKFGKKRLEQKFLGKKMLKNNLIKIIEKRYFNLKNFE